jgi:phosphoglycolate phosphatase
MIKHIVTDNDGTAIGFGPWFAPAAKTALQRIAPVLGVTIEELGEQVGKNMVAARTHEDAFVFRGDYFANLWGNRSHADFVTQVTAPFYTTLDNARDAHPLFDGASQTIKAANGASLGVHVLSDAALYATVAKLKRLASRGHIRSIYAIETLPPDASEIWNEDDFLYCTERVQRALAHADTFKDTRVVGLPRSAEKPNPIGLRSLMADMGIDPAEAVYIGDSITKDGGVAYAVGMLYLRFGTSEAPAEEAAVINELLNPDKTGTFSWHKGDASQTPVHSNIEHWSQILPMITGIGSGSNNSVGAC